MSLSSAISPVHSCTYASSRLKPIHTRIECSCWRRVSNKMPTPPEIGARKPARLCLYIADLNGRLRVGVVGNVGEDLLRVRTERGRKSIGRIKIEMPHGDIGRRRAGRTARNALLDRDALAGGAELLLDHGHVLGEVVVHVELAACTVGVEH